MDNTSKTLLQLVKELNVKISSKEINKRLLQHPNYPSLLSICDVLTEYNIGNSAYHININDLSEVPTPCIAHIRGENFILIKKIKDNLIYFLNLGDKENTVSISEFSKDFTGNILITDQVDNAGDPHYFRTRAYELFDSLRLPLIITSILLIFSYLFVKYTNVNVDLQLNSFLIIGFKSLGVVFSVLLLIQSVDSNNPFLHKLCFGARTNCNSILSSKASKILGGAVSLSEIGFYYFSGSLLLFLFNTHSMPVLQMLAVINLFSLPFTFYSIYYQKIIAKQWCTLCCTIQALLWLEFTQLGHYLLLPFKFVNSSDLANLFIAFALPALFWLLIKPYLLKLQSLTVIQEELNEFKHNEELFQTLLKKQNKYALLNGNDSLRIGDENAGHVITLVSNPFCGPCAKAHKLLDEWLTSSNVKFQLQLITASIDDEGEKVAKHLSSLIDEKDKALTAHNDWYGQKTKDYDSWASLHPENIDNEDYSKFKKQSEWCKLIELEFTPTILIDGHKLPKPYQLEDIKYFI